MKFIDFKKAYEPVRKEVSIVQYCTVFNFALEYVIMKFQEKEVGLKLNGIHQLLAYADDVNLLGDNIGYYKEKC
jgi:hypothetical protein